MALLDILSGVGSIASIISEIRTVITKYKDKKDENLLKTMGANIDYSKVASDLEYETEKVDKYIESKKGECNIKDVISKNERKQVKEKFYKDNSDMLPYRYYIDPIIDDYLNRVEAILSTKLTIGEKVLNEKVDQINMAQNEMGQDIKKLLAQTTGISEEDQDFLSRYSKSGSKIKVVIGKPVDGIDGPDLKKAQRKVQKQLEKYNFIDPIIDDNEDESFSICLGATSRRIFSMFEGSYSFLYKALGITNNKRANENNGILNSVGDVCLQWLLYGKHIEDNKLKPLFDETCSIYSDTEWLKLRWKAIQAHIEGDYKKALDFERKALRSAEKTKQPEWIQNDILIDCRNFEHEIIELNIRGKANIKINAKAQKSLDNLSTQVYLPVCDRSLENALSYIIDDEITTDCLPSGTVRFGTNIYQVVDSLADYYFSSITYGSFTHMILSRKWFARALYKYRKDTGIGGITFLKIYLLSQDVLEVENLIHSNWDRLYFEISKQADELWKFVSNSDISHRNEMRLMLLSIIGMYLSDICFIEAEKFLFDYVDKMHVSRSERWLSCVEKNEERLSNKSIVASLIEILTNNKFYYGSSLSTIILNLNLEDVSGELRNQLAKTLEDKLPLIIERKGNPQIISVLEKADPKAFGNLQKIERNGLEDEFHSTLYIINMGGCDWSEYVRKNISIAKCNFEESQKNFSYDNRYVHPHELIASIVEDHYSDDLLEDLQRDYFKLCIDIIKKSSIIPLVDICFESLFRIIAVFTKLKIEIQENVKLVIKDYTLPKDVGFSLMSYSTVNTVNCRFDMLRLMMGAINKDELLKMIIGFSKTDDNTKRVFVKSLYIYIANCSDLSEFDGVIPLLSQYAYDEDFMIRSYAYQAFSYLLQSNYSTIASDMFIKGCTDPSPYIRSLMINLCGEKRTKAYAGTILEGLSKDKNYAIRKKACEEENRFYKQIEDVQVPKS